MSQTVFEMDSMPNHPEERKTELTQAIPKKYKKLYLVVKGVLYL